MRLKVGVALLVVVAVFPALVTGVAQQTLHAVLVALANLVGGSHG
ncbi:MAG: hypothetical protein ACYC1D_02165 [Acidimicrobiales bacterium]